MGREEKKYAVFAWADTHEVLIDWAAHYGVIVEVCLYCTIHGASKGYVEVVLYERTVGGKGGELVRVRQPFSWASSRGQAGTVAHAVFQAFQALEANPWTWPASYRSKRIEAGE